MFLSSLVKIVDDNMQWVHCLANTLSHNLEDDVESAVKCPHVRFPEDWVERVSTHRGSHGFT